LALSATDQTLRARPLLVGQALVRLALLPIRSGERAHDGA